MPLSVHTGLVPEQAPDQPEEVEIALEAGVPVAVNGERLGPAALLQRLNEIGGRHDVVDELHAFGAR